MGFIPCHPMQREAMHPSLDAADHRWRDVAIIPVSLNHHLAGMKIVPPQASTVKMREILRVTGHHVHSQNATLKAPLGSLRLGLVVVHGKTEASGNRGNGDKTVTTVARSCGNGRHTVWRPTTTMVGGGDPRSRQMR